jgi:predicted transcriptional regulator
MVIFSGAGAMLIKGLLQAARERLVSIADDARLIDADKLLSAGTDLVIVCDSNGILQGVITKTDIVKQISTCQGAVCMHPSRRR